MQQPFGFLLGGASPFRTLLNTVRPDVPKPIQATGFINQPATAPGGPVRVLDASVPTYPTAFADVRASSATYFNSSGILSTAASNTQRIDYNPATLALRGLEVEPAATNLVTTSDFTAWNQLAIFSVTAVTGLDGTSSAYDVVPSNSSTSGHLIYLSASSYTTPDTNSSCLSVYAKSSDFSLVAVRENSGACAVFNVSSGTVTGTFNTAQFTVSNAIITSVGGGWYRLSAAFTAIGGAQNTLITFIPCDGWTTGDPYSVIISPAADNVRKITLFGPQAELGTISPSSVIVSAGSATTRAADSDSFTLNSSATALTFTFDDLSTQTVSGLTGGSTYTIPTNLNRPWILYIDDNSGVSADTGTGAAAGTSTVAAVGASLYAGVGSAAGTSTVSGVGASLAAATGAAAGTSTVTATGKALFNGVGSAAGTSTVTATGAALANSVGNAAGTSNVLATGRSTAASVGASAGVSTVSGIGAALAASVGSAAGTSTDAATGSSLAKGVGNAAGTSTVLGVSGTVAVAAGTSTVTGVGAALFNAVGVAAGTSTVTATGQAALQAVGTAAGASTVAATGRSLATGVGSAAGVGTAAGVGAAAGIFAAVGTAAGSSIVSGVGAASIFVQAIPPDPRASHGLRRIYPAAGVPGIYNADIFGGAPAITPDFKSGDFKSSDFPTTGTAATAASGASIYGAAGALNKPLRRTSGPQMRRTYKYPVQLIPGGIYDKDIYGQNIYQSDS